MIKVQWFPVEQTLCSANTSRNELKSQNINVFFIFFVFFMMPTRTPSALRYRTSGSKTRCVIAFFNRQHLAVWEFPDKPMGNCFEERIFHRTKELCERVVFVLWCTTVADFQKFLMPYNSPQCLFLFWVGSN